jgi:hypothetical protein
MTSLAQVLLANQAPPPRAKPAYAVQIKYWRPLGTGQFDVTILPCGLLMRGCYVVGSGEAKRVKAPGHEFATPSDAKRFSDVVLSALDAGE